MAEKKSELRVLAGILFLLTAIFYVLWPMLNGQSLQDYFTSNNYTLLIDFVGIVIISIMLIAKKVKKAAIGGVLLTVSILFYSAHMLPHLAGYALASNRFWKENVLLLAMYIFLTVSFLNQNAVLSLGSTLIAIYRIIFNSSAFSSMTLRMAAFNNFKYIFLCISFALLTVYFFWQKGLKHDSESREQTNTVSNENENEIDKLLKLKELLDKGIITQEEFEEKKKQLLEL